MEQRQQRWSGVAGRRVLLTGATRGIGLAAARQLAAHGAELAIVARAEDRGREAARQIAGAGDGAREPDVLLADLSSLASTQALAQQALQRYPRIDVLINNAGAMFATRQITDEGLERTWALNHLSPFLLTQLLSGRLRASAPARVITTASMAHRGMRIPFEDMQAQRSYGKRGFERYGQSKLANILFTAELARRMDGSGVEAFCLHPGVVASGFNRNNGPLMSLGMTLMRPFSRSPEKGAQTLVWLAQTAEAQPGGGYFADERAAKPSRAARDEEAARRLWEVSEEQVRGVLGAGALPG